MRWNIAEAGNQKNLRERGVWPGGWDGLNDCSDEKSGTRKFEGRVFEGRSIRNRDGGGFFLHIVATPLPCPQGEPPQ